MTNNACIEKRNQHKLVPGKTWISYETLKTPTQFSLPRVYTNIHDDDSAELFLFVGSEVNEDLLLRPSQLLTETHVLGKWKLNNKNGKLEIHLRVIVSSQKNPQAEIRNRIFCAELSSVLEAIGLAEQGLLLKHPDFDQVKVFVKFESTDRRYSRTEYWGKLKRWLP